MTVSTSKNMVLSQTLKLVRQRRGLKASEVARRMGLPLRTYSLFESGRTRLDVERIALFATVTDSDAHAILTAVAIGAPHFAARCMDNKLMAILIAGVQRFDERLGDDLARIEVARYIAAVRAMFDDLQASLARQDQDLAAWLQKPGPDRPENA